MISLSARVCPRDCRLLPPHCVVVGVCILSSSLCETNRGYIPPTTAKEKERHKETRTEHKANKQKPTRSNPPRVPLLRHLLRAGLDPHLHLPLARLSPHWAMGASCLGASASGALAPRTLRGGGSDFHPLASWRADLLAVQESARDPWEPPQLAHLVVPWRHGRPFPTRHPSTGHQWSFVAWSFAQTAHLGVAASQWGRCGPTHSNGCKGPPRRRRRRIVSRKAGLRSCKGDRISPRRGQRLPLKRLLTHFYLFYVQTGACNQ